MTPQWNADIITPEEKGSGTQVIGDNQQVQTTLESGSNITIEDGRISASGTLENVQADWTQSDSADPSYIKHKPTLATVATSGDYTDLTNKPDLGVYATASEVEDKADKVSSAVSGNLAGLNSNGNLTDSGVAAANLVHDASYVHTDNNFSNADVTKLEGIAAGAEVNVQSDWTETDTSSDSYIVGKPDLSIYATAASLATVATSGSYADLSNKPTIPDAQVQSNWNETDTNSKAYIQNKPSIPAAQVQSDWTQTNSSAPDFIKNKPTIPAGVVVDQTYSASSTNAQSGTAVAEAIASVPAQVQADWNETNSSSKAFIQNKPTIPAGVVVDQTYNASSTNAQSGTAVAGAISTKQDTISDLATIRTGAGLGATAVQPGDLATVATSGSYNDLSDKPTIPAAVTVDQTYNASSTNAQSGTAVAGAISTKQDTIADLATIRSGAAAGATAVQPSSLATVATTGDYADLQNKPSIPAAQVNSDWNSSSGVTQILNKPTLATVATTGDYGDLINKPSIPAAQVQSDWSQSDSSAVDFIKNKPTIPAAVTVDQVYNASSTNAQSGTAVAGALAAVPSKQLVAGSNITLTEHTNDFTIEATVDEVPAVTSSDDGKILKATYSGGTGSYAWATEQGATYTAGDGIDITNDVISADVDGTTIGIDSATKKIKLLSSIPTVDQTYNASSTNAQSGVAVAGAIAAISVDEVPAVTSSDDAKVLTATYSGGVGSYAWAAAQGGTVDQTYNASSTNAQSGTAVAGALAAVPTKPIVAGSNITITENANNITLAATVPTVDQNYSAVSTNAQSGVAVASAISTAIGPIETALSNL